MTALNVAAPVLDRLQLWASRSYPEECCGFLFSPEDRARTDPRAIVAAAPAVNERVADREGRFVISAETLRQAEADAERRGEVVTGFFHSHPDHPARPSRFDEEHAWPWYSYLIVASTADGQTSAVGSYELDPERAVFLPVRMTVEAARAGLASAAGTSPDAAPRGSA